MCLVPSWWSDKCTSSRHSVGSYIQALKHYRDNKHKLPCYTSTHMEIVWVVCGASLRAAPRRLCHPQSDSLKTCALRLQRASGLSTPLQQDDVLGRPFEGRRHPDHLLPGDPTPLRRAHPMPCRSSCSEPLCTCPIALEPLLLCLAKLHEKPSVFISLYGNLRLDRPDPPAYGGNVSQNGG
jgi:hypothetical protein